MSQIHFDLSDLWTLSGILCCFLLSCFFSATETALTSLTSAESERLSNSDNWWAKSLRHWIGHPNRLLATLLLANTLVNAAAAVLTSSFISESLGFGSSNITQAVSTAVVTFFILIFGEITPKMIARGYPTQVAPYLTRLLLIFNSILYPISYLMTRLISFLLKAVGIFVPSQRSVTSGDIERMIIMARRQGIMPQDKSKILSSVFAFTKRRVRDIMIPKEKISAVSVDTPLVQILDFVRQENHSRYPVYKGDLEKIIGFLHARDLFGVLKAYGFSEEPRPALQNFSLRTCLRRAFFVSEAALISSVLNEMKSRRIHLAIVKDEWGNVVGLVTLEDILEEVFGEIDDEHDERVERPVFDLYETGVEVVGEISISDLKTHYDVDIDPSESYSTLNGFLQHYTSHAPLSSKTVVIWKNYVFTILEVSEGEVHRVRITQTADEDKQD